MGPSSILGFDTAVREDGVHGPSKQSALPGSGLTIDLTSDDNVIRSISTYKVHLPTMS